MSRLKAAKRYRIHPAVAVAAMICLTALAVAAEVYHGDPQAALKIFVAAVIAWILGVKVRPKIPVT